MQPSALGGVLSSPLASALIDAVLPCGGGGVCRIHSFWKTLTKGRQSPRGSPQTGPAPAELRLRGRVREGGPAETMWRDEPTGRNSVTTSRPPPSTGRRVLGQTLSFFGLRMFVFRFKPDGGEDTGMATVLTLVSCY